ncbi:hypothetical protein BH10PAT3_BH10PAT3_7480 [soil metagenome]
MSSIDQQFIEYIVKSLVGNPEAVTIERRIDEKGVLLELTVDPEDLGRVIGKRGATAQSLRTLLRALGTKNEARYNLKIIDNGEPRPPREDAGPVAGVSSNDSTSSDDSGSNGDGWSQPSAPAPTAKASVSDDLDLDDDDHAGTASDKLSKTRQELKDLDDLDV